MPISLIYKDIFQIYVKEIKMKKKKLKFTQGGLALIFLAPSLIGFSIFFLIPFIGSLYYTVVNSPINGHFVGLENFKNLLTNKSFIKAAVNTGIFTFISVPLNIVLSLCLALLLNKKIYGSSIFRTAFIIPLVVPVASIVLIWQSIFDINGALNGVLNNFGVNSIDWMKTDYARLVIVIVYLWKNLGYNMILFLAGLQNIPPEYYEAAGIEGAGKWREFIHITIIYLSPTTFFVFIISIINSFKVFRETYLISGGYPHDSIYMLQHYMNNMFMDLDYQKLTTSAFIMAALIIIIVSILFKIERKLRQTIS